MIVAYEPNSVRRLRVDSPTFLVGIRSIYLGTETMHYKRIAYLVGILCAIGLPMTLRAQSVEDLLRNVFREQLAEVAKSTGMAMGGAAPVRLGNAIASALTSGRSIFGESQSGLVEDGTGEVAKVLRSLMSSIVVESDVGERLLVLAQCPGCSTFRMSEGDDAASAVGSYEIAISQKGQRVVPVSAARCRADVTCDWYAQGLKEVP